MVGDGIDFCVDFPGVGKENTLAVGRQGVRVGKDGLGGSIGVGRNFAY